VNAISGQRQNIVDTFTSLDTLAAKLVTNRAVVQRFIDSLASTTSLLADERVNFRNALVKLSRTVEVVAKFARDNKEKLKGTVGDIADVSDILLSRKPQLEEFIQEMPLLLQNIQRARVPSGLLIRGPLVDILAGQILEPICKQLPASLCDLVGTNPVGGLINLLQGLLKPLAKP
jgi:ABC-type transporter Mla subunit MlaD